MRKERTALTKVKGLKLQQKPNLAMQRARNSAKDKPLSAQQLHLQRKDSEIRATPMNFCPTFEIGLAHVPFHPLKVMTKSLPSVLDNC